MKQFLTRRARLESIIAAVERALSRRADAQAGRMLELFEHFPSFWCNEEQATQLRNKLSVVAYGLTGESNSAINFADALMREQAGLVPREEDTDPVFEEYDRSEGVEFRDGGAAFVVVGPCPVAHFRHAVVMKTSDNSLKLMPWSLVMRLAQSVAA